MLEINYFVQTWMLTVSYVLTLYHYFILRHSLCLFKHLKCTVLRVMKCCLLKTMSFGVEVQLLLIPVKQSRMKSVQKNLSV